MARINVRMPEALKARVEDAAEREGLSINAWLVRAAAARVEGSEGDPRPRSPCTTGRPALLRLGELIDTKRRNCHANLRHRGADLSRGGARRR